MKPKLCFIIFYSLCSATVIWVILFGLESLVLSLGLWFSAWVAHKFPIEGGLCGIVAIHIALWCTMAVFVGGSYTCGSDGLEELWPSVSRIITYVDPFFQWLLLFALGSYLTCLCYLSRALHEPTLISIVDGFYECYSSGHSRVCSLISAFAAVGVALVPTSDWPKVYDDAAHEDWTMRHLQNMSHSVWGGDSDGLGLQLAIHSNLASLVFVSPLIRILPLYFRMPLKQWRYYWRSNRAMFVALLIPVSNVFTTVLMFLIAQHVVLVDVQGAFIFIEWITICLALADTAVWLMQNRNVIGLRYQSQIMGLLLTNVAIGISVVANTAWRMINPRACL